jgi:ribosomal protein S24E
MELNIAQKTKEPLLSRMSVKGEVTFEAKTPSHEEMRKAVAASTKMDEKLVVVKHIYNNFGARKATFSAVVYDDEAALAAIEPKPKKKVEAVVK